MRMVTGGARADWEEMDNPLPCLALRTPNKINGKRDFSSMKKGFCFSVSRKLLVIHRCDTKKSDVIHVIHTN